MSTREERILDKLRERMAAIPGVARVEVAPVPQFSDNDTFPAIAIFMEDVVPQRRSGRNAMLVQIPIAVRGLTQAAAPAPGPGDVPNTPLTSAYALFEQMLAAALPGASLTDGVYHDRIDGEAVEIHYAGHGIGPASESGITYGAFLGLEVEYVLHLNDPTQ